MVLEKAPPSSRHRPSGNILRKGMLSCTVWVFPSPFACRITASICLRSLRVSLRLGLAVFPGPAGFACNRSHLLFPFVLPHKRGGQVVGLADPHLWTDKLVLNEVPKEHLQGLPVPLVHSKQEEGQHDQDHTQGRRGGAQRALG